MVYHKGIRFILGLLMNRKILSIGTKYYPTNEVESDYVDMFDYTQTMLVELKKANIVSENILKNLINELGAENIPATHQFIELRPAENKVDEYALFSNIVTGGDRYLYISIDNIGNVQINSFINTFSEIIVSRNGLIVERSPTEIVSRLLSKNEAIKVAIEIVRIGLNNEIPIKAAVGMTGAAAIERAINLSKEIGLSSGVGFTKLGGEYALVLDEKFPKIVNPPFKNEYYLFIDMIDSTGFINKYGRDTLVKLMNGIKNFIEKECEGQIEGYREGGDDLIARLPSKDLAMRAGIDSAWHAMNNDINIRGGIGKSRIDAGEKAQMADEIRLWNPISLIVFDLADGEYGYYIPSNFTRTLTNILINKKVKIFILFLLVALVTFLGYKLNIWYLGLIFSIILIVYISFDGF